jgi:tetratricopeptide (TPR) repeat protein
MFGDPGEPDQETVRLLEEALAAEPDDVAACARLLTRLAIELLHSPDEHRRSMVLFDEAVSAAEQSGDGAALVLARWNRRLLVGRPASPAERVALGEETLRLAMDVGDAASLLAAYGWLLVDHLEAGCTADARNDIDAYGALVQQLRMPYRRGFPTMWRSTLALLEGRVDDAEALTHESLVVAGDDGGGVAVDPMFFTNWSGQLFALRALEGRLGELQESVEMVVASKPGLLAWRVALAYLYEAIGDSDRAEALYREIVGPPLDTLPVDGLWLFTACLLAELAVRLDDSEKLVELEQLLRPCADRIVIVAYAAFSFGPVALRLGMLATKLGEHQRAERDLRDAIELSRASGAWPWVAAAELELAALYDVRHQPGDRQRARALRDAVGEAARENGWDGVLQRVQRASPAAPAKSAPISPW